MPVVGSGGGDGVDVFVVEEFSDILVGFDGDVLVGEVFEALIEDGLVGVADGDEAYAGHALEGVDV